MQTPSLNDYVGLMLTLFHKFEQYQRGTKRKRFGSGDIYSNQVLIVFFTMMQFRLSNVGGPDLTKTGSILHSSC